jgi:hypothetical protein
MFPKRHCRCQLNTETSSLDGVNKVVICATWVLDADVCVCEFHPVEGAGQLKRFWLVIGKRPIPISARTLTDMTEVSNKKKGGGAHTFIDGSPV